MKKEDFKPGQTVYLLPIKYTKYEYHIIEKRIIETSVLSVGRKYITVGYLSTKFDITNEFRESTNYSIEYILFLSKEDIRKHFKRRKMEERVNLAFCFPNHIARKMTFDELQTVLDIVNKYF